MGIMGHPR